MKQKFSEVLTIINGRNQKAVENPNGEYPIYGSGGIMGYSDEYLCPGKTVIIGRKGNINKPIYVEEPFWNVDTAFGLQANEAKLLPRYLFYFCQRYNFEQHNKTVTIPSLTKADLLEISIDVPEIDIQEKVCSELDTIDSLICNRQDVLLKLNSLVKSRFVEMFGDPIINHQGWKKDLLKNHADVIVGYPFSSSEYVANGIPIVGGYNLMQGFVQWGNSKYWQSAKGYEQYLLKSNDIVIAMDRPWVGNGFKIATIKEDELPSILIQRTACIRCRDVRRAFLYMLLDSTWFADHCQITGSLVPHISNKDILIYPIIVPPIALQNQFADFVALADKSKFAVQQSIDTLQTLKDKLMQDYFG